MPYHVVFIISTIGCSTWCHIRVNKCVSCSVFHFQYSISFVAGSTLGTIRLSAIMIWRLMLNLRDYSSSTVVGVTSSQLLSHGDNPLVFAHRASHHENATELCQFFVDRSDFHLVWQDVGRSMFCEYIVNDLSYWSCQHHSTKNYQS